MTPEGQVLYPHDANGVWLSNAVKRTEHARERSKARRAAAEYAGRRLPRLRGSSPPEPSAVMGRNEATDLDGFDQ